MASTVVLRVSLYHGSQKAREFEVHAGTTLLELRRVLSCKTQSEIHFQFKELQKRDPSAAAACAPPSDGAAFCIEDEWFVSGREDPSEEVRQYVRACGGEAAAPREMAEVTFGELRLRLGQPYLFVHHGSCEHALVFSRCSLLGRAEAARGPTYPRLVWERQIVTPVCTTCGRERAVWDVRDDQCADVLPCQLCPVCHYQFHYSETGVAQYTGYRIYPLLHEEEDELDTPPTADPPPLLLPPPPLPTAAAAPGQGVLVPVDADNGTG